MARFSRRRMLAATGAAAAAALAGSYGFRLLRRRPPNVVFIISDALRADRLGCYSPGAASLTPNLDRLASRGVLFEKCLSTSSWTMQSVASYMSSRLPFVEGDLYNEGFVPAGCATVAQLLQDAGYSTAALVKNPWLWVRSAGRTRDLVVSRGFDTYLTGYMNLVPNPLHERGIGEPEVFDRFVSANAAIKQALMLLPELQSAARPFFLYIHLMDTHEPYNPPDEYKSFCGVPPVQEIPDHMLHQAMRTWAKQRGEERLAASDAPLFERAKGLYDCCVRLVDTALGNLFDWFDSRGLGDDTIFIFSSDHGEEFAEHGWIGHSATLYNESLHVPLLFAGRGLPPGARIAEPATLLDLAPTILSQCGVEIPETMFGGPFDFTGSAYAGTPRPSASLVRPDGPDPLTEKLYMLHDPRGLKLIRHEYFGDNAGAAPREELYDLGSDPAETTDIASVDEPRRAALASHLQILRDANRGAAGEGFELDEETRKRLKALGYLNG